MEAVVIKVGIALIIAILVVSGAHAVGARLVGPLLQHPIALVVQAIVGILIFVVAIRWLF
jgi:hypothetical protein